jgi:bacteriocin biosynthesis cyclodehydratase domain-containing protein
LITKYYIHQSVELVYFGEDCQLKLLYDAFTIENGRAVISSLFEFVRVARGKKEIESFIKDQIGVEQSALDLVDFLLSKNILVSDENIDNIKTDYDGYIDIMGRAGNLYKDFDDKLEAAHNVKKVFVSNDSIFFNLLCEKISQKSIEVVAECADADMLIFVGKGIGYSSLLEKNETFFAIEKPYLLASVERNNLHIGPLTIPRHTSCYQCLHDRKFANLKNKNEFLALAGFSEGREIKNDFLIEDFVVNRIVNEVIKYRLGDSRISAVEKYYEIDMLTTESVISPVYKAPRCGVCSSLVLAPTPAMRDLL